ncbi:MAG: GTP cyclohydrolase II [Phycisphaerae bacterium]|jgi:3,4-dihydroxy 2-butanone 4-phosphate synthase/GTP cyclohydrolase II
MPQNETPAGAAGPFSPIDEILEELRQGRLIVLVDDKDRENEGDLVCAAQSITPEKINFMLRYGRGTLCIPLTHSRCERLHFQPQVPVNTTRLGTAFTVTVDGAPHLGVTTGVSAWDRAATIRHAVAEEAVPEDFVRPGHVNPLIARDGGVLVRAGQTEGSVDLCRLAGLLPGAVLIEILNDDGTMARVPELTRFCGEHGLKMCTVADLIEYRMRRERLVERVETVPLRNEFGEWLLIAYRSQADREEHVALCYGGIGDLDADGSVRPVSEPVLARVHSECLTGDVFGSLRCECGQQLRGAMEMIAREGRGVLVYLRQEGRGIGLVNKLHAYRLQDGGLDTVEANEAMGFPADRRDYGIGAQILRDLGLSEVRILTNNPKKISRLEVYGLHVVQQLPLEVAATDENRRYLEAKKRKMGHTLRGV